MKKIIILLLLVAVLVGGFLIYKNRSAGEKNVPNSDRTVTQQKWEPKSDDQAEVTVTVTPVDVSSQSSEWKFDVIISTHTVELDQDMTKVAVLIDDLGREYGPISWEGDPAEGHHREGVLTFQQVTPSPKSIELKVSGIGGVVRSFTWQLK